MENFEVIPEGKEIVPLEKSWVCKGILWRGKSYQKISKKTKKILADNSDETRNCIVEYFLSKAPEKLKKSPGYKKKIEQLTIKKYKSRINFHVVRNRMLHFHVLAKDKEDLEKVIEENWNKLKEVMKLFGEEFTGWRLIGE